MNLRFEQAPAQIIDTEPDCNDAGESPVLPDQFYKQLHETAQAQAATTAAITDIITSGQAQHAHDIKTEITLLQDHIIQLQHQQQPNTILGRFLHWLIYGGNS